MSTVHSIVRAFLADRRGAVAAMLALTLPVLAGVGAVAVDVGHARAVRSRLQAAVDLAAIAAASRLPDGTATRSTAVDFVARNLDADVHGTVTEAADVELGHWNAASDSFVVSSDQPSAVRVTARRSSARGNAVPTWFARLAGIDGIEVTASAIAGRGSPPACIVALHPSTSASLLFDSNARLSLSGCEMHGHSTNSRGLWLKSNGSVAADRTCIAAATYRREGIGTVDPGPETGCTPAADPAPAIDATVGTCKSGVPNPITDTRTLTPGTYCGLTIDSNSRVTLAPGTYVIKNAPLELKSNVSLTGTGVTIYLANAAACLRFDSNTTVSLTAPSTGTNQGLLIYQPQSVSCSSGLEFNSNSVNRLEGMIYAPASHIEWNSNASLTSPCLAMIGRTFEFNSNARITIDIDAATCTAMPPGLGGSSSVALLR
jgi:Flp pilus assembly protein TadG